MKQVLFTLSAISFLFFASSFGVLTDGEKTEKTVTNSKVVWKGYKVLGSHEGTIDISSGSLTFDDEQLVGGKFSIDMTSINCTDLEGDYKGQLEGHLKSGDFFDVEKFPTATLNITKAKKSGKNAYNIKADLTIKDVTKEVSFTASVYGSKATANIKIDRTDFNVKYGSASFVKGLKDKAIYDEFDLVLDVEF